MNMFIHTQVNRRLQVLDMLADIALAQSMSSKSKGLDGLLAELKCTIVALSKSDSTYQAISLSLQVQHSQKPGINLYTMSIDDRADVREFLPEYCRATGGQRPHVWFYGT